jgi:hypothetical protein
MSKENFKRDKPHLNIGVLLIVFSMISGFSLGMVIYNDITNLLDNDGDSVPDNEEDRLRTPLFFEVTDDLLTFSSYETGTTPTSTGHELGHNLGLSHGFSSHLAIQSKLFDDVSTGIPILDFKMQFESLIDFLDVDSNGYFDPVMDVIIGETALNNLTRENIAYGIDGQPSYYAGYTSSDGVFRAEFYISSEHVLLGRQIGLLAPNELKSRLTFTNYVPSTLTLKISFNSSVNLIFSPSGLPLRASTSVHEVLYEWNDFALTDGTMITVNTTLPSSSIPSNNGVIYVNLGQVSNGTYDTKLLWVLPYNNLFNFFDLPWNYISIGSITILTVISTTHVIRKKPGRLKYHRLSASSDSLETTAQADKRIPSTLKHSLISLRRTKKQLRKSLHHMTRSSLRHR